MHVRPILIFRNCLNLVFYLVLKTSKKCVNGRACLADRTQALFDSVRTSDWLWWLTSAHLHKTMDLPWMWSRRISWQNSTCQWWTMLMTEPPWSSSEKRNQYLMPMQPQGQSCWQKCPDLDGKEQRQSNQQWRLRYSKWVAMEVPHHQE